MRVKDFRVLVAELKSLTPVQRRALAAARSSMGSAGVVVALIEAEIAHPDRAGHRLRSLAINQARLGLDLGRKIDAQLLGYCAAFSDAGMT